jgi:hypothetical protein
MYVFSSSFRRTEVKNTVNQEQIGRTFNYIFTYGDQNGTDEIVIFDRFANTPIWYGLAVLTSGIFIAGTYIIISRKRSGETPTPVQSTKNDL